MKKAYVKPTISFESFKMSSSIAGTCRFNDTTTDVNSCSIEIGGYVIFTGVCEFGPQEIGTDVCYDIPTDDTRVFTS